MPDDAESTVEITHDTARDESVCGVFCDAEPEVSFEAFGYTFHWCRECYEEPCSRCGSKIAEGEGENRAKGWCQSCRDEIRLICGDDERGIQKDDGEEQAKLITDGGRPTAEALRAELKFLFHPEPDSADGDRVNGGKPVGMGPAAWEGCDCPTCRSERREYLGSEAADRDQQTLGGWSDE